MKRALLISRQRLPRPARLYSTPTKAVRSASATATAPAPEIPIPSPEYNASYTHLPDMQSFLARKTAYTILPTPLPDDRSSELNDYYFTDSPTQDILAVMGACLHNLHDVPRAKAIFDRMREAKASDPSLEPRLYNAFLEAYVNVASTKEVDARDLWMADAVKLYECMESGKERAEPVESTYAIMLMAWNRFHPEAKSLPIPESDVKLPSPLTLLTHIVERGLSVPHIVADRAFSSSEEAAEVIKALSKTAVELNMSRVVSELGQTEVIGMYSADPLDGVPEVRPVMKAKKPDPSSERNKEREPIDPAKIGAEEDMEVPFNLSNLRQHLAQVTLARRVLPEDVAARQKLLEESVYDVAVERLKHQADLFEELGLGNAATMKDADLQRWMWDWHLKLKARLEVEIKKIVDVEESSTGNQLRVPLGPFISLVKAEKLSLITILEIMRLQGSGGVNDGMKTARALIAVGRAVENEYKAHMARKSNVQIPTNIAFAPSEPSSSTDSRPIVRGPSFFSTRGYQDLHSRRVAARKYIEDAEEWTTSWSQALRVKMGSILVECLMDMAEVERTAIDKTTGETLSEMQPAFFHSYEYLRGQKLGVIRLNPAVAERMARDNVRATLHPRHLPMLVKPKPWINYDQGGYLFNKTVAMRFKDSQEQLSYLKHASALGNVELVYAGLDVLGATPWQINRDVFDIVLKVWNSGERLGKLPPAVYDQPEPEKPAAYDIDLKERSIYLARQKAYVQEKANNHSERCNVNYKIEIARAFLGDTFYQPHNLDFRGRAYPIPPHLNHIGNDLSRGILKFAESKALGERGLRWLKIHLANLYGFDKANFDERVQFVMDRLDEVYDSAERPLEGNQWWTKADDPWQCLATCMELRNALESPDPHAFLSSLPVHQDGTCNGLQHYAALGGDARGAAQVNLAAMDRPSDVYTYVGKMVQQKVELDGEKGDRIALLLKDKITRKVVKQTVMTTVYGVTFIGARDQIHKQLKDRGDIPEEDCWFAAAYLAKQVLSCIGDLFTGAQAIQLWLNVCARLISRSIPSERLAEAMTELKQRRVNVSKKSNAFGTKARPMLRLRKEQMTSVVWTTPLGLPIVQPYRKTKRKQIMTTLQTVFISDPNSPSEVNSMKQASAFPPNFIHSLDATHMMLTALECRTQGLTFASVHDSYWTHACHIDKMSETIRNTFIALHSSDVLQKLRNEFMERYASYKIPLVNLRTGKMLSQLKDTGATIIATAEQAKNLPGLEDIVRISEEGVDSTVEEGAVKADDLARLVGILKGSGEPELATKATKASKKKAAEISEDEMGMEDEEDFEGPPRKLDGRSKGKAEGEIGVEDIGLLGKFVNLTSLIPPLPKKGDFKVDEIKKSLYFFS